MIETVTTAIDWLLPRLPLILGALFMAVVAGFYAIRMLIAGAHRWVRNSYKTHGGTRRLKAFRTWFQLQPWRLYKAKGDLLASPDMREFYAPVSEFVEDREDGKRYARNAWLSEHPKAATASVKQNRAAIKGKHFPVRRQISTAGKQFRVRPLPDTVMVAGDRRQHFEVFCNLVSRF